MKKLSLCIILIFLTTIVLAKSVTFNRTFFIKLLRNNAINKEKILFNLKNKLIICSGIITSLKSNYRYGKSYRVVLVDKAAKRFNLKLIYHLYINNTEIFKKLKKDMKYNITGQVITVTPVNSSRTEFIIDMLFQKGVIIIDK
mgnify:CR=1 FL=1